MYNKLVTLISTCIVTKVPAPGSLVGTATDITQGGIDTRKLMAVDDYHQLQSILNKSHNFTYVGNQGKKLIAAGLPPYLNDCLDEGRFPIPNK